VIEDHALRGLAEDPGMGLGLYTSDELRALAVVRCGAAKDLYQGSAAEAQEPILRGESLSVYRRDSTALDPIAAVMVAGKTAVGRFGGALRRILYAVERLEASDVENAQCLTEQVTQKTLSVKAGQRPLSAADFETQLRRLLAGQEWAPDAPEELLSILRPLKEVWSHLRIKMQEKRPDWLEWLRQPHELAKRLHAAGGQFALPLSDLRMWGWREPM
jgi:hypothetical protein